MKNQEIKVSFYLKKNEPNQGGRCPIMARLSVGKSQVTFSTKLDAPTLLWAFGRVKGKSKEAVNINRQLDSLRASALLHYRELSTVSEGVTAEQVKNLVLGMAYGQQSLLAYFRHHNENFEKKVGVTRSKSTLGDYTLSLRHLTDFLKTRYRLSDISFSALDRSFIDKFDIYLKIDRRLEPGTIVNLTTKLNTIIRSAIAEGIITHNPFYGYVAERPVPRQKYLTREELDRLMTTPLAKPRQYLIRDLFLFSCYTGIPHCDMRTLTADDLTTDAEGTVWVKSCRGKTGNDYSVPLLDLPLYILDKYKGTVPGDRLLPMYHLTEINKELKNIASICGIDRRLTFHMARHTYATEVTLSQGVPIESVSRMLGHGQIKTTRIYAKTTDDKLDADMSALENRIAGKFKYAI
ncbi:MAG: site-specific integrase [Rikenellaceae bacterium]|nr:site-specific integrase [Rikenellaceae bacterium]